MHTYNQVFQDASAGLTVAMKDLADKASLHDDLGLTPQHRASFGGSFLALQNCPHPRNVLS